MARSKDRANSGPLVKWLRHRPFTAVTWVRVPYGSPQHINPNCFSRVGDGFGFCYTVGNFLRSTGDREKEREDGLEEHLQISFSDSKSTARTTQKGGRTMPEKLCPDFKPFSCNTQRIPAKVCHDQNADFLGICSCRMVRCCLILLSNRN